jgi:hypothetical protein
MAVYSLQKLIEKLTEKLGIELIISWTICSDDLTTMPLSLYDQGVASLKQQSMTLKNQLQGKSILLHCKEYNMEELSPIGNFSHFDTDYFILQGFSEDRQILLTKQISHLENICL